MLTTDLLRVRRQKDVLLPRYLTRAELGRVRSVAQQLIETLIQAQGESRESVEEQLAAVPVQGSDGAIAAGLRKLLMDRCELAPLEGADPLLVRNAVFLLAAKRRAALEPREAFDRDAVLAAAAEQLALAPDVIATRLYADLRANEVLTEFAPLEVDALLQRYDVALAQGVLLRATRVVVDLGGETPGRVRQLFRAARFFGLLHRVMRLNTEDGVRYRIELDGPLSLFSAVQKYGLKLAMFLPEILRCKKWQLQADVLWTKKKVPCRFLLSADDKLKPTERAVKGVAPEIAKLVAGFRKLKCSWDVAENEEIFALPGEAVCVPDLVFSNRDTGEVVYFEAFGFWSRTAVWQRIEAVGDDFPARLILAIGKQLRVSEELLDESEMGQIYVYKQTMRPRAVLEHLEAGAG